MTWLADGFVWTVLFIVLVLVIIFLLQHVVKDVFKAFLILSVILSVCAFIFGIFLWMDGQDFHENFANEKKTFLYTYNDDVLAGFSTVDFQSIEYLSKGDLTIYKQAFSEKNFGLAQQDSYKTIYIDYDLLKPFITGEFSSPATEQPLNARFVKNMLIVDDPFDSLFEIMLENAKGNNNIPINEEQYRLQAREVLGDDEQVRSMFFLLVMEKAINEKSLGFLVEGMKEGTAIVYPDSLLFRTLRAVPMGTLDSTLNELGGPNVNTG